jgi:hypothetical protein
VISIIAEIPKLILEFFNPVMDGQEREVELF